MEPYYIEGIEKDISIEDVSRRLGAMLEDDEDRETLAGMLEEASAVADPKAVFVKKLITELGEDNVRLGEHIFTSSLVREKLGKSEFVLVYTATCGTELDEWSKKYADDPFKQYFADVIKEQYLFAVIMRMRNEAKEKYYPDMDISSLPPGSLPEWPISEQKEVFGLLGECADRVGVTLTDSYLMIPSKSASGIFFSSDSHFESCSMCKRAHCQGRRAPYKGPRA